MIEDDQIIEISNSVNFDAVYNKYYEEEMLVVYYCVNLI